MGTRVARVECNGALEFSLRPRQVPFVIHFNDGKRGVSFGQRLINLQRFCHCWSSFGVGLLRSKIIKTRERVIRISHSRISLCVSRILLQSLGEILDAFLESVLRPFVPVVTPLQIRLISLIV